MEGNYREIISVQAQLREIETKHQIEAKRKQDEEEAMKQMIKGGSEDGDFEIPDLNVGSDQGDLNFEQSGGMYGYDEDQQRRETLMMASGRSADSLTTGSMRSVNSVLDDKEAMRRIRSQQPGGKGFCGTPDEACCSIF